MTQPAIQFDGVRKDFGRVVAVEGLDLSIAPGTFCGLIGHNGAGKSTSLRMLMGLLQPTAGRILIDGIDVHANPREARKRYGAVPEEVPVYEYLSAREYLEFVAEVRGGKTALAAAVLGEPKVLILDEALNGLDPPSAARVKGALRTLVDGGTTVLLSTHVVETVQAVSDRVVMLAHGRVVADENTADIGAQGLERLFLEKLAETHSAGR